MRRPNAWLALVLVIAGCGGEPPLAAADYFGAVEAELARLDQATRDLTDRYATELENELEALVGGVDMSDPETAARVLEDVVGLARAKAQSIVASHTQQLQVFADRVGELVPPEPVAAAHAELVEAMEAWAMTQEVTTELIAAAEELADVGVAIGGSPYSDAQLRVDQACRALEPNAAAVDISLTCPGTRLDVLQVTP